ncbi:MAG TPA: hypothetical protein VGF28_19940 [Thermoanaerobaculia bacterium]|jgi:hypothetical protein
MRLASLAAASVLLAVPAFGGWLDDSDCKYSAPRKASTPAAGITRVVIHADAGSLAVDGTAGATQVLASGTACTSDEEFLPRMTLTFRKSGSELHIEAAIPEKTVFFGFFSARLDFGVTLPAGLPVVIDDDSGPIRVSNTGVTNIDDDSGSIEVRNVRGQLVIEDDSGSIDVDGVAGDVRISDDSGEITVRNVTGNVEISDDSGAITVAKIDGSLRIRDDDSGSIVAQNVKRDVTIEEDGSGAIDVADIGGNFTVGRKGSGHISHERVAGKVSVPEED